MSRGFKKKLLLKSTELKVRRDKFRASELVESLSFFFCEKN
jgi:hypothetical protein